MKIEGGRGIPAVNIRNRRRRRSWPNRGRFSIRGAHRLPRAVADPRRQAWRAIRRPATASPTYGALIGVVDLVDCIANGRADAGPDETAISGCWASPPFPPSDLLYRTHGAFRRRPNGGRRRHGGLHEGRKK